MSLHREVLSPAQDDVLRVTESVEVLAGIGVEDEQVCRGTVGDAGVVAVDDHRNLQLVKT